ncbi:MAG: N-acetyltransferase [Bacteroidetes bacterium]|nr:N-acetyltransferase [Bacteroidota bacterium]
MNPTLPPITLRPEKPEDQPFIYEITKLAFKQENESILIDKLRNSEAFIQELSIVALYEEQIIGHILFTHLTIQSEGQTWPSLTLAPVSVHPQWQNKGIGGNLIHHGLETAKEIGFSSVVVLGHPTYYPRFGFQPASKWGIICPFPAPDEAFMALELFDGGLSGISGKVIYPSAFTEV